MTPGLDTNSLIYEAATAHLPPGSLLRVESEPYLNSANEEGLRVTLVLAEDAPEAFGGTVVLDTIWEVSKRLKMAGDGRQPMLKWATEYELAHRDDPDE